MDAPESGLIKDLIATVAASATLAAAGWGAAGGATSAIVIQTDKKTVIRQIIAGALIAAGAGGAGGLFLSVAFNLPAGAIPAMAGVSAIPYFLGVFGPALIEHRLRKLSQPANIDAKVPPQTPPSPKAGDMAEVSFDDNE